MSVSVRGGHEFKLNQSLLESSFRDKHLSVHRVRNSILRNVITQPSDGETLEKYDYNYEKFLKLSPLYRNEFTTFLRRICSDPDNRSQPNKNVIKRIMIEFFDSEVMGNIKGDSLFDKVRLLELSKGVVYQPEGPQKDFYLVLKGKLLLANSRGSSKIKNKEYYGHEELLSRERVQSVEALVDSVVLLVDEESFNQCLRPSFQNKTKDIARRLSRHPCFQNVSSFQMVRLLFSLQSVKFRQGEAISVKGEPLSDVYFLAKGRIGCSKYHILMTKGVGLKQITDRSGSYRQTVTAQTDCQTFSVPVKFFENTFYLAWLRSTLPIEPQPFQIDMERINQDKKSNFKVRKATMSIKKPDRRKSVSNQECYSFENQFLFLNSKLIDHYKFKSNKLSFSA